MRDHRRRRTALGVVAALSLVAHGCGDDGGSSDGAPSSTAAASVPVSTAAPSTSAAPTTTAATTTEAPTTTAAPATTASTAAPTTTAPLTAADVDLAATAIGPVEFGTAPDAALAVLTPVLGAPATDEAQEYPIADEMGGAFLDDQEGVFAFPFLRRICFGNGLCAFFGGASVPELTLVGYDYFTAEEPVDPVLTTVTGVPLGARWSDHLDGMTVQGGGCYSQGFGDADGVVLVVLSSGEFFGTFDGETYTTAVPDPSQVTVYGMFSGDTPGYLYDDC